MSWPPPLRQDRFVVGDEVWYHVPTVMDACRTWAPDISKPARIIAVRDIERRPDGKVPSGHTQMVRVSPNYCPHGDEFNGGWFLPVGIQTHNDPAFRNAPRLDQSE
jgi:hypothetical protein